MDPWARLSRDGVLWALRAVVVDRLLIARVRRPRGVVAYRQQGCPVGRPGAADPRPCPAGRGDGDRVDEHCWRHNRDGEKYVEVIIDLTPVRDRTGPTRLLDLVPGRSKAVFTAWLDAQTPSFRAGTEVVAMDEFTGYKTAAAEAPVGRCRTRPR